MKFYIISFFILFPGVYQNVINAQKPPSVSTYLCKTYDGFAFREEYKPVRYVEKMFWPEMSSAEAWKADSLIRYGDTIYYDALDVKRYVDFGGITQAESKEMITNMQKFAKQPSPGKPGCISQRPNDPYDNLIIAFSQPVYNTAHTKCLVTFELMSIDNYKKTEPFREKLILYYYKVEWMDGN